MGCPKRIAYMYGLNKLEYIKQPYLIHKMSNIRFSCLKNLNLANNRI
jgi:hypothetical protein